MNFNLLNFLTLNSSWSLFLKRESQKDYFNLLNIFLNMEYSNSIVFPPKEKFFNSFNLKEFKDIKVVIIGQDPYRNLNPANGLSFSVEKNIPIPRSLSNIYKELSSDIDIEIPSHGDLSNWSNQGVLLLNSVLTVRKNEPNSHKKVGWEEFTDSILQYLNDSKENLVFVLWGNYAIKKCELIDETKHFVLKSPHPSPFSARKGFFGSKPFSKTNKYLKSHGIKIIDWKL